MPIRRHVPCLKALKEYNNKKYNKQLIDTPTKVYTIGAWLFLSKVPLKVLQNWVLIQLIVTPHILGKVQGPIKEVCRLIESCLLIGTRKYTETSKNVRLTVV